MSQQTRTPGGRMTIQDTTNLTYVALKAFATCFTVFTRHSFGTEALGLSGVLACAGIFIYANVQRSPEMFFYFWVWLLALIMQRARSLRASRHGHRLHSQNRGYPWLGYLLPGVKSYWAAAFVECCAVMACAAVAAPFSKAMAGFFFWGSIAMLFLGRLEHHAITMELRRMRDAEIEMQTRADLYRSQDF